MAQFEGPRPSNGNGARGALLQSVIELWESHGIPYCILHGYKAFPGRVASDVDCVMPANFVPQQLANLLQANRDRLGAAVVQWIQHETGHYFILASDARGTPREFLAVDCYPDYRRAGRVFYRAEEILASRRRYRAFWVPSPAIGFGCYLIRRVAKCSVGEEQGRWLSDLYHEDPTGCDRDIARFWRGDASRLISAAAASGTWDRVREVLPGLRRELVRPETIAELGGFVRCWLKDGRRRIRRWREPTGAHVVLLGPDGAGKSSVVAATRSALMPAFWRVAPGHWAPGVFRRARGGSTVAAPHSRPPRSRLGSLAKAAYWLLDYGLGYYLKIRPALARSTLVLFDRYMLDALVDPRRYRYGGPRWALDLVWLLTPKPDLIILLDAPAEVVRARKQELSVEEIERQRQAYRALVQRLPNGHIVDAARPLDQVAAAASQVVLDLLVARIGRRLGGARSHVLPSREEYAIAAADSAGT